MLITDQSVLAAFCQTLKGKPFLTIDTEFLRDKTYYPLLCLIQVAGPGIDAVAIDPLVKSLDLAPLYELLDDPSIVKVFHAARQDLEIFYNLTGRIPHPLFDTQVAAMVCGHGDQIGYNNLVHEICGGARLDKGAQFTDWSRRPLSEKQMSYALDDVIFLRDVYLKLSASLKERGREEWVKEEMAILTDPATYENTPDESWQRIKVKTDKPKVLAVLKEIASWRESEAQRKDVPRSRIIRDETLVDMAVHAPRSEDDMARIRGVSADMAKGRWGRDLLAAVKRGLELPKEQWPVMERKAHFSNEFTPALEMLKMLLRIQCAEHDVAAKLVASSSDLELLVQDDNASVPALQGWRYEVFGKAALAFKHGKIALHLKDGKICQIHLDSV